jgi:hypothetical protein
MERLAVIDKKIKSINYVPLNKWRYGELKESLEKQLNASEQNIKAYRLETETLKQQLMSAGDDQKHDIMLQLYPRCTTYVSMLEKHLELKTKLEAINPQQILTIICEKTSLLEELCGFVAAPAPPPPETSQPITFQTLPPPSSLYSGIGLRYAQGC